MLATPSARAAWLAAPAGSGKTSLAAEWAAAGEGTPLWLRLDAACADPGWLWRRLLDAAGVTGTDTSTALGRVEAWVQPARASVLAARAFWTGLPAQVRVVLDDCDAAAFDPADAGVATPASPGPFDAFAAGVIAPLLAQAGPGQRLLLLARRAAPAWLLPQRAAGLLREMPGDALRLDDDERRAWQAPPRAEGWALAAAWLAREGAPQANESELIDWIVAVLLPALPASQRALLASAAWWPEIVATSLDAAGQASFQALASGGVLLERSAPDRLRLHPLLQQALQEQARRSQPATQRLAELGEAARARAAAGRDDAALALWQAALVEARRADPAGAEATRAAYAAWIVDRAGAWLAAGRHRQLAAAADAVPAAERGAALWLALAQALAPFDPMQARDAADHAAARAARHLPEQQPIQVAAQVLAIATQFQAFDDPRPLAERLAQLHAAEPRLAVDRHAPATADAAVERSLPLPLAGAAVAVFSALFLRTPAHPELPRWRQQVRRLLDEPTVDANLRVRAGMLLAKDHWYRGRYDTLALLPLLAPTPASTLAPYGRLLGGLQAQYAAWAAADWPGGIATTQAALAEAESSGIALLDRHLRLHGACFAQLAGEAELAARWMAEVAATADASRRMEAWHHRCVHAWLALIAGHAAAAAQAAEAAADAASAMGPAPRAIALAVQAHALLDLGETGPRWAAVRTALGEAATPDNTLAQFHQAVLDARWAQARGDADRALPLWHQALLTAKAHALWAPLGASPAALADGLAVAMTANLERQSAQHIALALKLPAPRHADGHWPWALRLQLADGSGLVQVLRHGEPLAFEGKPPRRLLELLRALAESQRPVAVADLLDRLWPDLDGDRAAAAFEVALRRLRSLLGVPQALRLSQGQLTLDRGRVWVEPAPLRTTGGPCATAALSIAPAAGAMRAATHGAASVGHRSGRGP
jgi:hypothetical protein